ncbi:hypothetical protein PINS_up010826, partial [Pythium insidiosum]
GSPFVEWSFPVIQDSTIATPDLTPILLRYLGDVSGKSTSIQLLILGNALGEVSAFDGGASQAPTLEVQIRE